MGRKKKIGLGPEVACCTEGSGQGQEAARHQLDPFGYMHVRKVERELLAHYEAMVADLAAYARNRRTTTAPSRSRRCRTWFAATRTSSSATSSCTRLACANSVSVSRSVSE